MKYSYSRNGETLTMNIERFSVSGTIVKKNTSYIGENSLVHHIVLKTENGIEFPIDLWNSCKGYKEDLKVGDGLSLKGVIHTNWIYSWEKGSDIKIERMVAHEMKML